MVQDARETAGNSDAALKVGLIVNHEEQPGLGPPRWTDVRAVAEEAEQAGFDSLWLGDYFPWRSRSLRRGGRDGSVGGLEGLGPAGAVASGTSPPRLGSL